MPARMARKIDRAAAVAIAASVLGMGVAGHLGYRAGTAEAMHALVGEQDSGRRVRAAFAHALGHAPFRAGYGQDVWVLHQVFADVRDGYFVDLGSADGVEGSNTKALEERGWTGLCIDPFPRNMRTRRCTVIREAVDSEAGREIAFQRPGSVSGGLVSYAGWWVSDEDQSRTVRVTTTTLADVLDAHGAPEFIHYMNVDIEGAEYAALQGFPFDRYRVGAITVEHNNVEPHRQRIRALLERHGYRLEWAIRDQDWYRPAAASAP